MSPCPKCRTPSLERVSLSRRTLGLASQPQRCRSCKGLWLDGHLEEAPALLKIIGDLQPAGGENEAEGDALAGLCPEGHGILTRARVGGEGGFFLDRCSRCSGVWFDAGELARVAQQRLLDSLDELWTSAWQRQQRQRLSRQRYLQSLEAELGEDLLERLVRLAQEIRESRHREQILAFLREESGPGK